MQTTIINLIISVGISAVLFGCSGNQQEGSNATLSEASTSKPAEEAMPDIINDYMKIKEALVSSDPGKTKEGAVAMLEMIDATSMPEIQQNTKEIAGTDDLETQRVYFDSLSSNMYEWVKASGKVESPVYWQFCPMAFNNKGGYWLSVTEEIRNPYYGDKMMKCGSTEDVIEPAAE